MMLTEPNEETKGDGEVGRDELLFSPEPALRDERNKDSVLFKLDHLAQSAHASNEAPQTKPRRRHLSVSVPQGESGLINIHDLSAARRAEEQLPTAGVEPSPSADSSSSLLSAESSSSLLQVQSQVDLPAPPERDPSRAARVLVLLVGTAAVLIAVGAIALATLR